MKGYLIGYDGRRYALPEMTQWSFTYGMGEACDSYEVECLWGTELEQGLSDANRFEAVENGTVVFRGVVDEYECCWGSEGRLVITGRGMQALLLDNEAMSADYQVATLEDILRDHVTPYGIQVAEKGNLPAVPGFSVASGSSEWQALKNFACYHGGVEPRFDREGRLLLTAWKEGTHRVLDDKAAVKHFAYRERRYGVESEVLVRDRFRRTVQRVTDPEFLRRGGQCRRVITMPGRSNYQAMRYSGQFQLEQSRKEQLCLEVMAAQAFFAWPGDTVELRRTKPRLSGVWRVGSAQVSGGKNGVQTKLKLESTGK